jgi:hypothetical protein
MNNTNNNSNEVEEIVMPTQCERCNRILPYICEENCDDESLLNQELPVNPNPGLTRIHTSALNYHDDDGEKEVIDLKIKIPTEMPFIPELLPLVREHTPYMATRQRVGDEKYFRQSIQVFNKAGKLVNSGFIQINDYTQNCKMVKVCNKHNCYLHAFERWEHYGTKFFKTDKFNIVALESGNVVDVTVGIPEYITKHRNDDGELPDVYYSFGDLERDMYSEVLLECLEEMSAINTPQHLRGFKQKCIIENENSGKTIVEIERILKDELKKKAWYEIERVFAMNNLEQEKEKEEIVDYQY